ncbi:TPA: hypothetical protein MB304_003245 [Klebsiella pneumoniae]|nr:hypothetical protein [Klebsiella pneumoniae]
MNTCPDIQTLRTTIPSSSGEVIYVQSYYSNQTPMLGGGIFTALQDTVITDDGGVTIRASSNWVWKRTLEQSGTVSPYMFGAKGDGISDDTNSLQKAHDYARSLAMLTGNRIIKSGCLTFGTGQFKCTSTLFFDLKKVDYDFTGAILNFTEITPGSEENSHNTAIQWQNNSGYTQGNLSVKNLRMLGPGADKFVDGMTFSTSLSNNYPRNSLTFFGGGMEGFTYGITGTKNFYFLRMYGYSFNHCDVCYYFPEDTTDSGEEMNFHSCIFTQSNCAVKLHGGYSYFFNCSFDYIYGNSGSQSPTEHKGKYIYIEGGQHIFRDCHIEGYGPQNYILSCVDDKPCKVNFSGGLFTFKAGGSPSNYPTTSNPFYCGNKSRVVFEKVNLGEMQAIGDSNVTGWFDGTGSVSLHDTQLAMSWPNLLTQVRTNIAVQDNWLDSANYSGGVSGDNWTEEVWVLPPGGSNSVRKSRYGWGTNNSTNFSIIRNNNFISLGRNNAAGEGVFQAVLGTIKLKGYGSVIHHIKASTYAGTGQNCIIKIVWAKLIQYGSWQDKEPRILFQETGHIYSHNFTGSDSILKSVIIPGQMQGGVAQSPSIDRAPDWATHAFLLIDITPMAYNYDLRISDVYMRQV